MTFTKIGSLLSRIIFGLAIFRLVSAVAVLSIFGNEREAVALYLGSSRNTGEIIDQAFIWLMIAVALGILVNISNAVTTNNINEGKQ